MEIKINYDGGYPNLCSGNLIVTIDSIEWKFPTHCLSSGGSFSFDDNRNKEVTQGDWSINKFPDNFPDELKKLVEDKVNDEIPQGCCGGCAHPRWMY